jgi:hypothetical protein
MPILLFVFFCCGVGVPPAQKFDEKEYQQEVYCLETASYDH